MRKRLQILKVDDNRYSYASDGTAGGEWTITILNNYETDIVGADYSIVLTSSINSKKKVVIEGKDIYKGTSEIFNSPFINLNFYEGRYKYIDPNVSVEFKLSPTELLNKYYQPTGNEYKQYIQLK